MKLENKKILARYIIVDFLSAGLTWVIFSIHLKVGIIPMGFERYIAVISNTSFILSLLYISVFWIFIYFIFGYYRDPFRKSRLNEFKITFIQTLIGTLFLYLTSLIDTQNDKVTLYLFFILQFTLTFLLRYILIQHTVRGIHDRLIGFNTVILGESRSALKLYNELTVAEKSSGFFITGFVNINGNSVHLLEKHIPYLGEFENINEIITAHKIEEVIIAVEPSDHDKIEKIISALYQIDVHIKIIPDTYTILSGQVKLSSVFGTPLMDIKIELMPTWQQFTKSLFDLVFSFSILIIMLPLFIIIAIIIKLDSTGPVIYSQERIGHLNKPFKIFKFRSMYIDAESHTPLLACDHDIRITRFGRIIRKFRLDEIPQFFNVLRGDMSIVGPRPERQHFIELIKTRAPHYKHLHKIKPGITSWGQVKYGYAQNVDQMIRRLNYDILYITNMSLLMDIKILIYTIIIVIGGKGK